MRVTFLIGATTVLAAGGVAFFGVSHLASQQTQAQDTVYLQVIEDGLLARLQSVDVLASRVANAVAGASDAAAVSERITFILEASDELVSEIDVIDVTGTVIASTPTTHTVPTAEGVGVFREAMRGVTGFSRGDSAAGSGNLWLTRAVLLSGRKPVVILMKVDTHFVRSIIDRTVRSPGRVSMVVEGSQLMSATGDTKGLRIGSATWANDQGGIGGITVQRNDGPAMRGYYNTVEGIPGIDWRVVVLQSNLAGVTDAVRAVAPSVLVLGLGGLVALVAAWFISLRLVEPLRALEAAAYQAASGSYVKPISEERDDEIGQVARAFNAVALRLNALHDLSQLLASASQLDQVLDGILSAMGHLVGPGTAAVYLLDEQGRWLLPVRARGVDITLVSPIDAFGDGWVAAALTDTEPALYASGSRRIIDELPGLGDDGDAALVAPLIAGHESLGVVVVLLDSEKETTQAEREMVRTFSAQAAVAVQNSRLFAEESESRRVSEGMRRISERLSRPVALGAVLPEVGKLVAGLFSAHSVVFAFVDRNALGLPATDDLHADSRLLGLALRRLPDGEPREAVLLSRGEDPTADGILMGSDTNQLLLVPVALDKPHGAVMGLTLSPHAGKRPDLALAATVADGLALALENAYLYGQALSRAANLETIFRISQAVGSSLQVNVVLNRVLDVVQKILSADALALMTYDPRSKTMSTAMARGAVSPDLMSHVFSPADDVPGYVFTTGAPATYRDLHEGMGGIAGDAAAHGLRSLLAVPLLARGRSIGVLTVFSSEPGAFSAEDTSTLQTFASQAALAIDTARLYSREHEVASILQRSIVQEALPEFAEIETGSVYVPAGGETEIGGDYYDLFRSKDGRIVFVIADVCGKGVTAATKTSMIKYSVRSLVAAGLSPAQVLGEVNRMVTESGDPGDIVTLWLGQFDPIGHVLVWASGGHPSGLIRKTTGGELTVLDVTGPLLGALSDVAYGEQTVALNPGDTVLLYTDGVTEARTGTSFFGEDRVRAALLRGGSADEVAQRLLVSVRRFVRAELRDDVAILVLRVRTMEEIGEMTDRPKDNEADV